MARILAFATVLFTFSLPMFANLSFAQTLSDRCGDPPPVANESLKGEIKGQVSALSRLLGQGTLEGQIELAQKEIFSKYPEAEMSRSNASYEYYFCLIIMDDEKLTTQQKIDELIRVRGWLQREQLSLRGSLGTSTINKYFIATLVSAAYSRATKRCRSPQFFKVVSPISTGYRI